jgi:2-methylisocitrate lyase-like PEP mutase family enzyme
LPSEIQVGKIRAAAAMRHNPETFIMARTDALAPLGLDEALRRAELYLKAGADGVYIEAVETVEQLQKVGQRLRGAALATSILEGGGRTPWMDPKDLHALGYTMLLYPTTVVFRVTRAIQKAVGDLKAGRQMPPEESVTFKEYEDILGLPQWAALEDEFVGKHEQLGVPEQKAR